MTVLTAMRDASVTLIKRRPSVFFSSTEKFEMEMVTLLNQVAGDICRVHDWQALTKIHSFQGDGVVSSFPKPADYDRMLLGSEMSDDVSWFRGYEHCPDISTWIALTNNNFVTITPGWWILLGDRFQFNPAIDTETNAQFPYISNLYARSNGGVAKAAFTADDDAFILDEQLLTLALIWRWRENNHLDATGDQANFEKLLSERAARDGGSRMIRANSNRIHPFPWRRRH